MDQRESSEDSAPLSNPADDHQLDAVQSDNFDQQFCQVYSKDQSNTDSMACSAISQRCCWVTTATQIKPRSLTIFEIHTGSAAGSDLSLGSCCICTLLLQLIGRHPEGGWHCCLATWLIMLTLLRLCSILSGNSQQQW